MNRCKTKSKTLFDKMVFPIYSLTLLFFTGGILAYNQLPIQREQQIDGYSCGRASLLSIMNRYNVYPSYATYKGQCVIARYLKSAECCDDPLPSGCDAGTTSYEMVDAYDNWGIEANRVASELDSSTAYDEISALRPFNIHWTWDGGGGHWITCIGDDYITPFGYYLWYMDPAQSSSNSGYWASTFDWMVDGDTHTWTRTVLIDSSNDLPDNVYLRYTYNNDNYTYGADGNIYLVDFEILDNKTILDVGGFGAHTIVFDNGFKIDSDTGATLETQ